MTWISQSAFHCRSEELLSDGWGSATYEGKRVIQLLSWRSKAFISSDDLMRNGKWWKTKWNKESHLALGAEGEQEGPRLLFSMTTLSGISEISRTSERQNSMAGVTQGPTTRHLLLKFPLLPIA